MNLPEIDLIALLRNETPKLIAALRAVEKLHQPIRVYDECEHENCTAEPVEIRDEYFGCADSAIGWSCASCCYDDEFPIESCPHGATHFGVARRDSRLITYTQQGETGASLRAAGWRIVGELKARKGWDTPSRPRDSNGVDGIARTLWEAS